MFISVRFREVMPYARRILSAESSFLWLAIFYGVAISVLTLSVPLSVQLLIDTVANTALMQPVITLSLSLLGLLAFMALLYTLRTYTMDLFGRRLYARLSSEIALRAIYADQRYMDSAPRDGLFNRFFDIMTLQRQVPSLLDGAASLFLQMLIGFVLVSLYHPLLLLFNVGIIIVVWLIWKIWGGRAIASTLNMSEAKYESAAWLEELARGSGFFKSKRHLTYALEETDERTDGYIKHHKTHVRASLSQTAALFLLYAVASAGLLALGGWLVIEGQLSLGQLVAAELVMSAIFVGLSQSGTYLSQFYDICAAVEELDRFHKIPLEENKGALELPPGETDLVVKKAVVESVDGRHSFSLTAKGASIIRAKAPDSTTMERFCALLRQETRHLSGTVELGGVDLTDCSLVSLRQDVIVLAGRSLIPLSIRHFLELSSDTVNTAAIHRALEAAGLAEAISDLEKGLDTPLNRDGHPLTTEQTMRLKLAGALLMHPHVLVLTPSYDLIDAETLSRLFAELRSNSQTTILYFTSRDDGITFDSDADLSCDTTKNGKKA